MCGIIAVARRRSERTPPEADVVLDLVSAAADGIGQCRPLGDPRGVLEAVAAQLAEADGLLRGTAGVRALIHDPALVAGLETRLSDVAGAIAALDRRLDEVLADQSTADQEAINAALVAVRDGAWAIGRDRLRTARAVAGLAGPGAGIAAIEAMTSVQMALSALDRLEVRGRDSAGISVLVHGHGLDLTAPDVAAALSERTDDPNYGSGSVRIAAGALSFVYKAAAEIGELGDNSAHIRSAIAGDDLLLRALTADTAEALVLGHTRWASVGIISQANAHPVNSDEADDAVEGPFVNAALNGDIDNFADLKAEAGLRYAPEITTDAKVIPTLVSRAIAGESEAGDTADAFRRTVARFDGSVAIAASVADTPGSLLLALRGSGQALYIGLADDLFLVASEPYGVVEECTSYLRMDGETPADDQDPTGSRGQVVVLDALHAGTVEGMRRLSYSGLDLPLDATELATAEVTTRDIDRGDHPHFLLKEISESPSSFRKTLRGKIGTGDDGQPVARLGRTTLPAATREALAAGGITRVIATGQGTAAVAGQALASTLANLTAGTDLRVEARLATELSGFGLLADMSDTLVVAVSQSGTTTDTNRTVDLVRQRGATVISIVNRRGSDLTDRSDGVLYTSDGRDVEMSVASTKAFYAQVAAGVLLACAISAELDDSETTRSARARLLTGLRAMPEAMEKVLATRPAIAAAAQKLAPPKRYWAIVGSGADRIAAQELRIKLSELCYKSIACDATEDKKHIDLSSEPMIVVCAAGLQGSNADDVAKEVAIYRAHKASPVVIASEGEERFSAALEVLTVPVVEPSLAFVLATVVGHLFGYEAALAIDASALPLRQARAAIEHRTSTETDGARLLADLRSDFGPLAGQFFDRVRSGGYDGSLEAGTAVRLASLMRYATGLVPLDVFEVEHGRAGTPVALVEDLNSALTDAIEELTRPVDAIKHQAKTVTVGISRSDEGLLQVPLVAAALEAGAPRDRVSYRALRTLAGLDPAVEEVTGYTRYAIEGEVETHEATVRVIDKGGISRDLPLRTVRNPVLRGTKHRVAMEREVTVAVGRSDGRTVVIIPEVRGGECTGLTLLHCRFADRLPATRARSVLEQYRTRLSALTDAVTETEPTFRDDLLGEIPMIELLTSPVYVLAERWRAPIG